jgi:DNA-binding SARP family transcriptional activator
MGIGGVVNSGENTGDDTGELGKQIPLRYRVLGPVEFRADDGEWRSLSAPKWAALLTALLANANRVVPMARLQAYVWGDQPPKSALKLLQVYVHRLRNELPHAETTLCTRDRGYQLNVKPGELDTDRFVTLAGMGRCELEAGRSALAAGMFRDALAMWRGIAFEDLEVSPNGRLDAMRLEELRLAVLELTYQAELDCGRHKELIGELSAMAGTYPLRERFHEQLILALSRSGRRVEAIGAFQQLRRTLAKELGVRPGPLATGLAQSITGAASQPARRP